MESPTRLSPAATPPAPTTAPAAMAGRSDAAAATHRTIRRTLTAAAVAAALLVTATGADTPAQAQAPGFGAQVYGDDSASRTSEAVERAVRVGALFDSPRAGDQLRIGVLRHLTDPTPLPPPTTVIPNPETLDMSAAWDGDSSGDILDDELNARVVDLARRSGIAIGPIRTGRSTTTTTEPTTTTAGGPAVTGLVCPVAGPVSFVNDWGFPRSGGRTHRGNDLFAIEGTPIVAVRPAVITRVSRVDRGLGGLTVSYIDDRGDRWYNAHLLSVAPGIDPGTYVEQGQVIGFVGRTGNARSTPPHNHIQWHPGNGDPVNPYPSLRPAC
jgi:murein DD-endopeptidase MepM/ murein hydrolase activator NlpD